LERVSLFYEYFHGDTGAGVGASHQTGWSGAIARVMHLFASSDAKIVLEQMKEKLAGGNLQQGGRDDAGSSSIAYQVNTRVWLTSLSKTLGRPATLDDIPDAELDRLAGMGFDWVWFLSVWQTGPAGRRISRENRDWQMEFRDTLPDLRDDDIGGSGFAITAYAVPADLGGGAALARLRRRLAKRGLNLMLDFVPNHMAPDHPGSRPPGLFRPGTEDLLAREPQNYLRVQREKGDAILAYGRDPYFSGWPDTLQLDYSNPRFQEAMIRELEIIAASATACACDMAMLILPEVFERRGAENLRNSGRRQSSGCANWSRASVSWPRFTGTWNGRCSNRGSTTPMTSASMTALREGARTAGGASTSTRPLDYQARLARFLENHDEPALPPRLIPSFTGPPR